MGNQIPKEDLTQHVLELSKARYNTTINDNFINLIPSLLSPNNTEHVEDIFRKFDYEQVLFFSNNLCSFMKYLMKEKLTLINQTSALILIFSNSIYQKYLNVRELVSLQYHLISEEKKDSKEAILTCFPYNCFLFAIEALCNDEFLILKDVFQKEIDKFDFIQKTTELLFLILHHLDYPITKNALSSIEYIDTIKLFLFPQELFIKQSLIKGLLTKLYNTSIHNFANLISNRVDPNIPIDKFESFLFMNISIILHICLDINITLIPIVKDQSNPIISNTFNQRSLQISKALHGDSIDSTELVNQYISLINQIMKDNVILTSHLFRKFITEFYSNIDRLTIQFQIMIKIFMMYIFENNSDICEMICLSNDIFHILMSNLKYTNAFDIILLHFITQTQNFHLMAKHLNISKENICHDCLCTLIEIRNSKRKLTYSLYYCLLIVLNLASSFNEISPDISNKLNEFYEDLISTELTIDDFFHTVLCITLYFEIIFTFINRLEFPSNEIFSLVKINKERLKCQDNLALFYKNNFEFEKKGQRLWDNYNKVSLVIDMFIGEVNKKIIQEGCDINYSQDSALKSVVNKFTFKKDNNSVLNDAEKNKNIFNSDVVKFLISTLHSYEEYNILT